MDFSTFPITLILIAVNCLLSFICFSNSDLLNKLIFHPPAVAQQKQWYRFLSSGFIHKDGGHLLFNMLTLFFFGQALEPGFTALGLGPGLYLVFYLTAIIVSEIPTYIKEKNNENYYSLGASGAVAAVVFAMVLFAPWEKIYLKMMIPIPFILYAVGYLIYSAYMARKGTDNIGHSAHLWGSLYGLVFMIIAYPDSVKIFIEQIQHPHF
ncbi:MAG: rhomboid family intramembrane serine protease [Ferruginibacter sp.]